MRSRRFKITLITATIVVTIGFVGFGIGLYRAAWEGLYDVYVPDGAAYLVIEHMKANDGAWPRSWEELHKTFLSIQERNGVLRGFRWEEYPRRVGIDFTADPAKLARAKERRDESPFHVIWSLAHPEARTPVDPNIRLLKYLREQEQKTAASN
jgi:hypothetical protein